MIIFHVQDHDCQDAKETNYIAFPLPSTTFLWLILYWFSCRVYIPDSSHGNPMGLMSCDSLTFCQKVVLELYMPFEKPGTL